VISRNGIGLDNIDLDAAREKGIAVTNVPAYCIPEVADHAMTLALALARKLQFTIDMVRGGTWDTAPLVPIRRLKELTFGILGLGRIGRAVAERARPFFKEVIGCDIRLIHWAAAMLGVQAVTHKELFQRADILTLHVPLSEQTKHIVNARTLGLMKSTAYLVNTCRGAVVDTEALVKALQAGKLGGAGLDVHEQEPLPADHPLRSMPNVIITPHAAFYSEESVEEVRRDTCLNVVRIFQGPEPISRLV
jgi:D-3-phosphoglycerate dehydrogenase